MILENIDIKLTKEDVCKVNKLKLGIVVEPPRVCRRLYFLRG
jgi:hypothetical protein